MTGVQTCALPIPSGTVRISRDVSPSKALAGIAVSPDDEDKRKYIGKTVDTTVTSVLQTSAGRMIFARPN